MSKRKSARQKQDKPKAVQAQAQPFMRLAGSISGPKNPSTRKGFSRN
jgi:hypothetical protein